MKVVYKLKQEDYLQYALFYDSIDEQSKKLRWKAWASVILAFIIFGVLLYNYADGFVIYVYAITATLVAVAFPFYHKSRLKKLHIGAIKKNYKHSFDKPKELLFDDDFLEISSELERSKLDYSAIESIQEIASHYFLNLKSGIHIIIPKATLKNDNSVATRLDILCKKYGIVHSKNLDWKW
ncbi:YcxB family protein [Maribacter sp. MMG018]|uniref:YcxB family protein n=1 Tax=Maribacter sp. MMG018 TaxID=2822688 RepID=UPI001B36AC2A|nr:YcxB family protein [Maribacter sp. MMG018]MBQ4912871.1 YcxB family protein [Maribacter sp. MMG018]